MTLEEAQAKQEEAAFTWAPRFTESGEQIEPLLIVQVADGCDVVENPEYAKSTKILP